MAVKATAGRILRDDERALLEAAVRSAGPRLLAYARRGGPRGVDPEDIVAETFCRAAANIEAWKACDNRDVYLFTIARNLCRDGFRRLGGTGVMARERLTPHAQFELRAGDAPPPVESLQRRQDRERVAGEVAALPDELRELVLLRTSAGLKFEEIASLLQIPLGTALSRMRAALARLRTRLTEASEETGRSR